jgi:tricarballylate dehydrogenase
MIPTTEYDVVVLGGGNAALCAALTAREAGARVIVVERAPREFRGGNSRHTRNLRCAHDAPTAVLTGSYSEDEFFADLRRVNANETDEALARLLICQSKACTEWMARFGVRLQSALRGTLHLSRTNAFFLGGGKALMNSYYAAAARLGIDVLYDAEVVGIDVPDGEFRSVRLQPDGRSVRLQADHIQGKAVVLATGGFESNLSWLKEAWGAAADNFIVRGTPYNTGTPLRLMLDAGAQPIGDPRGCHAIAVDARAPKFDGGIASSTPKWRGDSCRRCFLQSRPTPFRSSPRVWVFRRIASAQRSRASTRPFGRGRSTTKRSTTAARRGSSRKKVTGRSNSTRRLFGDIPCVRASRSPISGCALTRPAG